MTEITERTAACGHEFVVDEAMVGRLVWSPTGSDDYGSAGWWLEVPGAPAMQLYEVPVELAQDLERARRDAEGAAQGFAQIILSDRISGLITSS